MTRQPKLNRRKLTMAGIALAASALVTGGAAHAEPSFEGQTIDVLTSTAAGGGVDLLARAFAEHVGGKLPGNPTVIVRNMPGGGGVGGLNFLAEKAAPDGLTLHFGTFKPAGLIAGAPGMRFDPQKLGFIGAGHTPEMVVVRTDTSPGLVAPDEIMRAEGLRAGGRSGDRATDIVGNMSMDIMQLDHDYRYIPGFRDMSAIYPAILRNDVNVAYAGAPGYNRFFKDTLVKDGTVLPLWYQSAFDSAGNPIGIPSITDMPAFHEVYQQVHGTLPSGPKWEAYKWYRMNSSQMTMAVFTAPSVDEERLSALRDAFYALENDPGFQGAMAQLMGMDLAFTPLDVGLTSLATFMDVTSEIRAVFEEMATKGL